ncbi:acetyltransferase (GNAT) family protein [Microterricola gilva]|uniref:Acetyltransferase (GNAT) family protein n=1 Tax=Microterricola gilva TaxID=393267 RepID=A0A4Q8AIN2_9MICO|nr:GNAT family N-acetyltransferase [Microterricola gilva]RZU63801.1 acetyltransferase (GNAT) family protein [Microterricola gilva]
MPEELSAEIPVTISIEPPFSSAARAVTMRYFDDLVSRYHGRPATAEEIADVDAGYPSELLQEPNGLLLLARRGETVLGCAGMRLVTEPGGTIDTACEGAARGEGAAEPTADAAAATSVPKRVGEVTRVFVDGSARGLGVARLLMAELEVQARSLGLAALRLDTRSDLVEARRLYAAVGFAEVDAHNADPYAEHWFRKELD